MKKQLLILTTLVITSIGYSQTVGDIFVENFITYEITSLSPNEVHITSYNEVSGGTNVNIPATVINNSFSYAITQIRFNSFFNKSLTSLTFTLPSNLTHIGLAAFKNNLLTNVIIPNSVTTIDTDAFYNNDINTLTIPNSVTTIGVQAFQLNALTSLILPDSVTSIGSTAFANNQIASVTLPIGITSIPIQLLTSNQLTSFEIPNTVTSIGENAFGSNQLTSITIPNSVISIGNFAFTNNQLTSVSIPNSVTSIGNSSFLENNLNSIALGNNVTTIGNLAFAYNNLTTITLPASVNTIGFSAFRNNPLTDVSSQNLTPPAITTGANDTFSASGDRSSIHLHIPPGTMGAYVTNSGALWTGFNPVTEDALSIDEFELSSNVKVITLFDEIKIIASNNLQLQHYTIYNISGAKVAFGDKSEISSSFLARGIYILKIEFDKGTAVRKVIIN